jgi:RNA polymerase sigma-70 factor (ECF subfamily)
MRVEDSPRERRPDPSGLFDDRYRAFLTTVTHLRASLHRYCSRMTGSALDGEDVMQEALFEAYRKLETLDDPRSMRAWLFRIAHHRCIDLLRSRRVRERAEARCAHDEVVPPVEPPGAQRAVERLVLHLPPKERACVLLKDVFDYSLGETADLVGSTVGGVKAALSRGRGKLASLPAERSTTSERQPNPERAKLLRRYLELFNRRDWEGVRALTAADARLRVADCYEGLLSDSPYFVEYERSSVPWRVDAGTVDRETVLIVLNERDERWQPVYPVRIWTTARFVTQVHDYHACPWIVEAGDVEVA